MPASRISVDPGRMADLPTIRDTRVTRVTVGMVLGQPASGRAVDDLLGDYPYLDWEDLLAALRYGAAIVNGRLP